MQRMSRSNDDRSGPYQTERPERGARIEGASGAQGLGERERHADGQRDPKHGDGVSTLRCVEIKAAPPHRVRHSEQDLHKMQAQEVRWLTVSSS